jgi:hypothetical protein
VRKITFVNSIDPELTDKKKKLKQMSAKLVPRNWDVSARPTARLPTREVGGFTKTGQSELFNFSPFFDGRQ